MPRPTQAGELEQQVSKDEGILETKQAGGGARTASL